MILRKYDFCKVLTALIFMSSIFLLATSRYTPIAPLEHSERIVNGERHMVIVTCSYNNQQYYQKNLDSVFSQEYANWHMIYVDDRSSDDTYNLVKNHVEHEGMEDKVIVIHNQERHKAMSNLYSVIRACKPTDIIVILDGDDWLSHPRVLAKLNQVYSDPNVWLTYGQFRMQPGGCIGFCEPYPQHIINRNGFRTWPGTPSHLRTFYAGLFHKIKKDDLMYEGDFFSMTYDLAMMFPMVEMARTHFKFIPDVLLEYNNNNPISDHRISKELQRKFDQVVRGRACYQEIENPF